MNIGVHSIYSSQHDLGLRGNIKAEEGSKNDSPIVNAYADHATALTMEEGIRSPMRAYSTANDHVPADEIRQEVKVQYYEYCTLYAAQTILVPLWALYRNVYAPP